MRKILIFLLPLLFLISCKKDTLPVKQTSDVKFSTEIKNNLKTSYIIDHVKTVIDNDTLLLDVFYDNGQPFTTTFQLSTGTHQVKHFIIYDSLNNPIGATPLSGTPDSIYVTTPLPINFNVIYGEVTEINIDVVYDLPSTMDLNDFGYAYYGINPIYLRNINLYGMKGTPFNEKDSLLPFYMDGTHSDYAHFSNGINQIMPLCYWIFYYHKTDDGPWVHIKDYVTDWDGDGKIYNLKLIDYENHLDSNRLKIEFHTYYPTINSMAYITTGWFDYDWDMWIVDDSIVTDSSGLVTFAYAPDTTWFPNVQHFFEWEW